MSGAMGLSKSTLDIFKDCPRCFWLDKNKGVKRPEGLKAGIINAIDDGMKQCGDFSVINGKSQYLDELDGAKPFPDRLRLKKFMSWRTFQTTVQAGKHSVLIWGNLDDLIIWPDGRVSAWDYKSAGKDRDFIAYTEEYNSLQADMYDLLLKGQNLLTTGMTYFTYTWPVVADGVLAFEHKTIAFPANDARALKVIEAAVDCLLGPEPASGFKMYKGKAQPCEYCEFVDERIAVKKEPVL